MHGISSGYCWRGLSLLWKVYTYSGKQSSMIYGKLHLDYDENSKKMKIEFETMIGHLQDARGPGVIAAAADVAVVEMDMPVRRGLQLVLMPCRHDCANRIPALQH